MDIAVTFTSQRIPHPSRSSLPLQGHTALQQQQLGACSGYGFSTWSYVLAQTMHLLLCLRPDCSLMSLNPCHYFQHKPWPVSLLRKRMKTQATALSAPPHPHHTRALVACEHLEVGMVSSWVCQVHQHRELISREQSWAQETGVD